MATKHDPRERRHDDRRLIERRKSKRGVNVRVDDKDGEQPKRIRREATWLDVV